jgi:hypothetical protein
MAKSKATQTVTNKTEHELVLPSIIIRQRNADGSHILHPVRGYPDGKILKQCPLTKCKPGANAIPVDHWDLLKDHKITKRYLELGFLALSPASETE